MEFEEEDDRFTLYWRTGHKEVVRGTSVGDAMTKAGYGNGSLIALDFFSCGACVDYEWKNKAWVNTRITLPLVCKTLERTSAGLHMTGGRSVAGAYI